MFCVSLYCQVMLINVLCSWSIVLPHLSPLNSQRSQELAGLLCLIAARDRSCLPVSLLFLINTLLGGCGADRHWQERQCYVFIYYFLSRLASGSGVMVHRSWFRYELRWWWMSRIWNVASMLIRTILSYWYSDQRRMLESCVRLMWFCVNSIYFLGHEVCRCQTSFYFIYLWRFDTSNITTMYLLMMTKFSFLTVIRSIHFIF